MQVNWYWLIVGLIPYSIRRQQTKDLSIITIKALLWRLAIRWKKGQCSWSLLIPFFEHLQH